MQTATHHALQAIAAERQRQIEVEGRTPEHDDTHRCGEMALAAACYAISGATRAAGRGKNDNLVAALQFVWPRKWSWLWWKPASQRRDLERAGALIVAELERLERLGQ